MLNFLAENLAPIMFLVMILFLLSGFPVAFSLAAVGVLFGIAGIELGLLNVSLFQALPERIFGIMRNDVLLAIPFFTFMGLILERSGMAEELLDTMGQLMARLRGGLAYAVIFVGALLAATTGVVAASVISMGLISLPLMLRYGYDKRLASGVIAASGTLAQIIPPSLVLIIMADQMGRSVGDMYRGAFLPGLILTGLYAAFILLVSLIKPASLPALPPEVQTLRKPDGSAGYRSLVLLLLTTAAATAIFYLWRASHLAATMPADSTPEELAELLDHHLVWSALFAIVASYVLAWLNRVLKLNLLSPLAQAVVFALIPPLGLIFLVLGTIFVGIATPTEGGAMGATGALVMALARRKLSKDLLVQAMNSTAKLSAFVLFIVVCAGVFALTFRAVNGDIWVEHLLSHLPGGVTGFLIFINVLFFVLAFFLDFFELSFILVPLLAPIAEKMGIDLVWLGVLLGVNLQTSFMHPPFGFSLFYLRSVAPKEVKTTDIYWGAIPFVVIQVIMVGLILVFPGIVSYK